VKHAMQRGILGINSAFAPGLRKTTENLDRVGRSQDLPDKHIHIGDLISLLDKARTA
jgi:hypothetical protein